MTKLVYQLGRGIGALSGAAISVLWMLAVWMPSSGEILSGISFVVSLLMAMIGLFAVIAALRGHVPVLIVAFVASYFPVGFYLTRVDHWLTWAGWLDFGYAAAGALIWLGRRADAGAAAT